MKVCTEGYIRLYELVLHFINIKQTVKIVISLSTTIKENYQHNVVFADVHRRCAWLSKMTRCMQILVKDRIFATSKNVTLRYVQKNYRISIHEKV